jgi:hypothetical protein
MLNKAGSDAASELPHSEAVAYACTTCRPVTVYRTGVPYRRSLRAWTCTKQQLRSRTGSDHSDAENIADQHESFVHVAGQPCTKVDILARNFAAAAVALTALSALVTYQRTSCRLAPCSQRFHDRKHCYD